MLLRVHVTDGEVIGNARLAGLEADLGVMGNDYNLILSVFYISYIIFEIPANVLCKWMGPGWFLPLTSLGFGLVSIFTAFTNDVAQISGVRFVLGIFEAGMLPGIAYYMSRWYRRSELTFRLSLYIVMAPLAGAFGGLLASAILSLDKFGMFHSWRMIFGKVPLLLLHSCEATLLIHVLYSYRGYHHDYSCYHFLRYVFFLPLVIPFQVP